MHRRRKLFAAALALLAMGQAAPPSGNIYIRCSASEPAPAMLTLYNALPQEFTAGFLPLGSHGTREMNIWDGSRWRPIVCSAEQRSCGAPIGPIELQTWLQNDQDVLMLFQIDRRTGEFTAGPSIGEDRSGLPRISQVVWRGTCAAAENPEAAPVRF